MRTNRWISIAAAAVVIALPLAAQQKAPEAKEVRKKTVVVRNGEQIEVGGLE